MPTLLVVNGYAFRFRMGDCAERPHVHVSGNGGAAKVWLDPTGFARYRGYNGRQLGEVLATTRAHATEWIGRWHEVCG